MADLLGAELPDLDLDLSGLELATLDLGVSLETPNVAETTDIVPEDPKPTELKTEEKASEPSPKAEENAWSQASDDWCDNVEESEDNSSSFQVDYRAAALRSATMIDMDSSSRELDSNPDAFEGFQGITSSITIREATRDDAAEIIELAGEMAQYSMSPFRPVEVEKIAEDRRNDLQCIYQMIGTKDFGAFVARDEKERLVGHILVKTGMIDFLSGEAQAWVFDISVTPKKWGSGVSKRLLHEAENFVRSRGMRHMGLTVTVNNSRALRFYQHAGYQEERYQMLKMLEPIDLEGGEACEPIIP